MALLCTHRKLANYNNLQPVRLNFIEVQILIDSAMVYYQ